MRSGRLREDWFRRPPAEFRGAPFWAWNCHLDRGSLLRQIGIFQRMGFGGFQMHARTGLKTPYLGEEFGALLRACADQARRRKLLAWLYDEDRWPSGYAGGLVTQEPRYRIKYVLFTRTPYSGVLRPTPNLSYARAGRTENGVLLARYAVRRRDGFLAEYHRLGDGKAARAAGAEQWFAYLESAEGTSWFNHQTYVDTLSVEAMERFVSVTYERMKRWLGDHFGGVAPAIFTDEPQHIFKECFPEPQDGGDLVIPATSDFFATYRAAFHSDLLDFLPEIFWELPGRAPSLARYRYHDHATERFAGAFAATLGTWCRRNGIKLTGHMMEEPTLFSQTRAIGEAMRSLAHFDLPGVDMLCDRTELTTVKQAQSIARQYGRSGVMSELYGATGWSFDFVGHKGQGDWQAALGVTIRVPHLAWASMKGEAKRDYPASIHYQSPWWRQYRLIEDHFARLNVAMTRGRPVVNVAVIHPIESYWLCYGPVSQTKGERDERDRRFGELPEWLLGGLIDFDYLCESLLRTQPTGAEPGKLQVGRASYETVIVPSLRTLRTGTLELLERFADAGGKVLFAGEIPTLVDARASDRPQRLAGRTECCPWSETAILSRLEERRQVDCLVGGVRVAGVLHQLRADGPERHLFLCLRDRVNGRGRVEVRIRGSWNAFRRDTSTGRIARTACASAGDWSVVPAELPAHGHLLLTLRPRAAGRKPAPVRQRAEPAWKQAQELADPVPVVLSEPNALLLDLPEWRWRSGPWQGPEEILRIDNRIRRACGLPKRDGSGAQPWVEPPASPPLGEVSLRFRLQTHVHVSRPELAIEGAASWRIALDGKPVRALAKGWWVDEAIERVPLPPLPAGEHELVLTMPFAAQSELEACYLLGDFGVALAGRHAALVAPVRALAFGDWTPQGLPFYTGNVTYQMGFQSEGGRRAVHFPRFKAPVLEVAFGGRKRPVAFAPFRCDLGRVGPGFHRLEVTAFGDRHNVFGPLHNIDPGLVRYGPGAWRTEGDHWAYEYQLRPMGLLAAPRIEAG